MFDLLYLYLKNAYNSEFNITDFLEDYVSLKCKALLKDQSYYEDGSIRITLSAGDISVWEKSEDYVILRYNTIQGVRVQFTLGSWIASL